MAWLQCCGILLTLVLYTHMAWLQCCGILLTLVLYTHMAWLQCCGILLTPVLYTHMAWLQCCGILLTFVLPYVPFWLPRYLPPHMEYILQELFKNAFRATVERFDDLPEEDMPPVTITVCKSGSVHAHQQAPPSPISPFSFQMAKNLDLGCVLLEAPQVVGPNGPSQNTAQVVGPNGPTAPAKARLRW